MAARNVEFALIDPSSIIMSTVSQVEIHLQFTGVRNGERLRISAEQGGQVWDIQEIDETSNTLSVNILSETTGAVLISVKTDDGRQLSRNACIASVPQDVHDDLNSIFERSMEDVMSSVRAGSARDPSLTATQLEDNPLLVRKVAWRDYFHWMIADYAGLLEHMNQKRENAVPGIMNTSCEQCNTQLHQVIKFLSKNNAYDAGTYLLRCAAASGEVITLDGVPLTFDGLDLQELQSNS